jgi:Holliday junction resolvase RusA-like endonuclease
MAGVNKKGKKKKLGQQISETIAEGIKDGKGFVVDAMEGVLDEAMATDLEGKLIVEGQKVKEATKKDKVTTTGTDNLYDNIVKAIKDGLKKADITVYMDGNKVTNIVNKKLGTTAMEGRFASN